MAQAAAGGYLGVSPDYLGLGYEPGTHPYFDIPTEATASVDMLTATRSFAASGRHTVSNSSLVAGFSQGASAALATAQAVEQDANSPWRVRALAPISGAYDITGAEIPAVFAGVIPQPIAVYYVTYLLVAANPIHHLYDATSGIFRAPYASRVRTLFGSNVTEQHLMAALPQTLDELLTPPRYGAGA